MEIRGSSIILIQMKMCLDEGQCLLHVKGISVLLSASPRHWRSGYRVWSFTPHTQLQMNRMDKHRGAALVKMSVWAPEVNKGLLIAFLPSPWLSPPGQSLVLLGPRNKMISKSPLPMAMHRQEHVYLHMARHLSFLTHYLIRDQDISPS